MRKFLGTVLAAAAIALIGAATSLPASAAANPSKQGVATTAQTGKVTATDMSAQRRWRGHRHHYHGPRYYAPRYYPSYGYYRPRPYYGPRYYAPRPYYGGPAFGFGFGPRYW